MLVQYCTPNVMLQIDWENRQCVNWIGTKCQRNAVKPVGALGVGKEVNDC
jgi:hypothetical protein